MRLFRRYRTRPEEPRIYYLQIRSKLTQKLVSCRTLAHDRDEAVRRAVLKFGPLTVLSSGTCVIPVDNDPIYGRGLFLASRYDHLLPPRALLSLVTQAA